MPDYLPRERRGFLSPGKLQLPETNFCLKKLYLNVLNANHYLTL